MNKNEDSGKFYVISQVIGVLASIGIIILFISNIFWKYSADGSFSGGMNIDGPNMIAFYILVAIVILSAITSAILKKRKNIK
ncbi:hypothetical protein [Staphylococcus caeli]|uniref:Uncharacterized protein n=1 Tax=Staphylococcus caeli TaxID=2201815 RepID=A0A1D4PN11_9STAP|nr:hypothetical protein [Staphylococcus caeli]SCT02372.1 Uncharacterised protein [Staphylococcus caeli]SCT24347.1 Uncharacterised protein [Staphylococcus caeli]